MNGKKKIVEKDSEVKSQSSFSIFWCNGKRPAKNARKVFRITVCKENAKSDDMTKFLYAQTPQHHNIICSFGCVSCFFGSEIWNIEHKFKINNLHAHWIWNHPICMQSWKQFLFGNVYPRKLVTDHAKKNAKKNTNSQNDFSLGQNYELSLYFISFYEISLWKYAFCKTSAINGSHLFNLRILNHSWQWVG